MRLTKSNVGLKTVQNLTKTDIKMKNVILFALFFSIGKTASSQVFLAKDKSAQISFFSETPMENIDAKSDAVTSIYNSSNDSIIVKVQITTFVFPKSLMQEHFNENYLESSKYPFSVLRGKLNKKIDATIDGDNMVTCTANLTIHGVTQPVVLSGNMKVSQGKLILDSKFLLKLADYDVKIPKLVVQNIAESLEVKMHATYSPYVKK